MKLHERLPDSVTVNGKKYRVDLDFRNVLRMMETLDRQDILAAPREYLALKCVMKRPPTNTGPVLEALKNLLFPPVQKKKDAQKMTDFAQDADLIRAAFLQSYGINLWRDRLHWLEFTALLSCIPEGSRYSEVIGIRARPIPEPTKYNAKERQWLMEAKARYAVQMTEKEAQSSYQTGLHNMAMSLLAMAQKGGAKIGE